MARAPDVRMQISPEQTNYIRLDLLVNDDGTNIVTGFFDSKIPPRDLAAKLADPQVFSTLQKLKKKKVLNGNDWDNLFPSNSSTVESKSFDLALLVKLLRQKEISGLGNPVNGWDNLPSHTDTTLEADIARLKWYRNTFAHSHRRQVGQDDFNDHWDDIKGALLRIVCSYSPSTVAQWEEHINNLRTGSLSSLGFSGR